MLRAKPVTSSAALRRAFKGRADERADKRGCLKSAEAILYVLHCHGVTPSLIFYSCTFGLILMLRQVHGEENAKEGEFNAITTLYRTHINFPLNNLDCAKLRR